MDKGGVVRAVQEEFPINRQGRSYYQPLARTVVDFVGNGIELLLAIDRQVCALWQVLAHQPDHVLIGATLPGAMRVAKVHRNARFLTELFVHRQLPTLVVGHTLAQRWGNAHQFVREALQYIGRTGGLYIGQLDQHQHAAGAVKQSAHRAEVGPTLDQVAFWSCPFNPVPPAVLICRSSFPKQLRWQIAQGAVRVERIVVIKPSLQLHHHRL